MQWLAVAVMVSAAVPLAIAWRANTGWTIRLALAWGWLGWLAWVGLACWPCTETAYAAVTLTAAAGVAVMGARRPGIVAWNFIVASLLVILWISWVEGLIWGSGLNLSAVRLLFVSVIVGIVILNYIPTHVGIGAFGIGLSCVIVLMALSDQAQLLFLAPFNIGASLWIGMWTLQGFMSRTAPTEFNRLWRGFRNRYGAIWAERVREQFNNAARNNQWQVHLSWTGLRSQRKQESSPTVDPEWLAALMSLTKRFRYSDEKEAIIPMPK
jgi:hypothetical protein